MTDDFIRQGYDETKKAPGRELFLCSVIASYREDICMVSIGFILRTGYGELLTICWA